MPDQTTSSIHISATPHEVMAVIADFEAYPEWTGAVKEAEVLTVYEEDGLPAEVRYKLDSGPIKDEYVLGYVWEGDHQLHWSLAHANLLRVMDGTYTLDPDGAGGTQVTYQLAVELPIPMLGMVKRKAEKVIIDTALKELKKRVEG